MAKAKRIAATIVGATLALAACTSTPSNSDAPTQTPSPIATSGTSPSPVVMELPPLPDAAIATMWSRKDHATGVTFVALDGEVLATVRNATIYEPGGPGPVVLVRGAGGHWVLDVNAHQLRKVSVAEANEIGNQDPGPRLAIPSGSTGEWIWVRESQDGTALLGQYAQNGYGAQLSECAKPIAMIQWERSMEPEPITGQSLRIVQPTSALGWTSDGHAVVAAGVGPCSGDVILDPGVYFIDETGGHERLKVPEGSYSFQMWSGQ